MLNKCKEDAINTIVIDMTGILVPLDIESDTSEEHFMDNAPFDKKFNPF